MRNPELWDRLEAYSFDARQGSAPYSVKLARAEGWNTALTARVIEEYRRFLYLTQVADRQVTPSQKVDAAWHMHLTFTRDYWDDLCPKTIGAPVHHQPCAGEEEMPRYRDQFAATKALYEAEFGHEPPADIWGGDRREPARGLRALVLSEAGSGLASPAMIAFVPFSIALVLAFVEQTMLSIILALVTGALFVVVLLTPKRRRRRRGRGRGRGRDRADDWDEDDWIDHDGGRGSGGGRGVGSKRSNDGEETRTTGGSGGFFAFFTGGDDSGSSDDGGGCGGCGGD